MKRKREASGWPTENMSDEDKNSYIDKYLLVEGIQLYKDKIAYNPRKRMVLKSLNNSLWVGLLSCRQSEEFY